MMKHHLAVAYPLLSQGRLTANMGACLVMERRVPARLSESVRYGPTTLFYRTVLCVPSSKRRVQSVLSMPPDLLEASCFFRVVGSRTYGPRFVISAYVHVVPAKRFGRERSK